MNDYYNTNNADETVLNPDYCETDKGVLSWESTWATAFFVTRLKTPGDVGIAYGRKITHPDMVDYAIEVQRAKKSMGKVSLLNPRDLDAMKSPAGKAIRFKGDQDSILWALANCGYDSGESFERFKLPIIAGRAWPHKGVAIIWNDRANVKKGKLDMLDELLAWLAGIGIRYFGFGGDTEFIPITRVNAELAQKSASRDISNIWKLHTLGGVKKDTTPLAGSIKGASAADAIGMTVAQRNAVLRAEAQEDLPNDDPAPGIGYYYHFTRPENLESILRSGIKRNQSFTPHTDSLRWWAFAAAIENPVVFRLKRSLVGRTTEYDAQEETAELSTSSLIPASGLEIYQSGKWRKATAP